MARPFIAASGQRINHSRRRMTLTISPVSHRSPSTLDTLSENKQRSFLEKHALLRAKRLARETLRNGARLTPRTSALEEEENRQAGGNSIKLYINANHRGIHLEGDALSYLIFGISPCALACAARRVCCWRSIIVGRRGRMEENSRGIISNSAF